jgi:hypothetical protein
MEPVSLIYFMETVKKSSLSIGQTMLYTNLEVIDSDVTIVF